jgi:hypothetical protein
MGTIFISYRREETAGEARALFTDLEATLGAGSAFMDVDNISLGRDFRVVLQESLASCGLMIVLIGKDWLFSRNEAGQVRLENPDDFVRLEVGTALKRNIPVTPVLIHGARIPSAEQLPEDLKDLSYRNGFELSHNRWKSDVQEMIKRLGLRPTSPPKGTLTNKRLLAVVAGACVFAIAVAGWVFVGKDAERIEPPHKESQGVASPLIGGTASFYSCTSRTQCAPGNACIDNGGDKSYYCKPYCAEDSQCANARKTYSGVKCLPLRDSPNLQICNDHESSLIPEP